MEESNPEHTEIKQDNEKLDYYDPLEPSDSGPISKNEPPESPKNGRERDQIKNERKPEERKQENREENRGQVSEPPAKKQKIVVDRENSCPFLLRVFVRVNADWRETEFQSARGLPAGETHVHTWPDCTLRELVDLLKETEQTARRFGSKCFISLVYPDKLGKYVMREGGAIDASRPGPDDGKTLDELRFMIGDMLAISIFDKQALRERNREQRQAQDNHFHRGGERPPRDRDAQNSK